MGLWNITKSKLPVMEAPKPIHCLQWVASRDPGFEIRKNIFQCCTDSKSLYICLLNVLLR
jgi:hypothetical protein